MNFINRSLVNCEVVLRHAPTYQCQGDVPHSALLFSTVLNKKTRASGHNSLLQKRESTATEQHMHGIAVETPVKRKPENVTFFLINIERTKGAAKTNVSLRKITALAVSNAIAYL